MLSDSASLSLGGAKDKFIDSLSMMIPAEFRLMIYRNAVAFTVRRELKGLGLGSWGSQGMINLGGTHKAVP